MFSNNESLLLPQPSDFNSSIPSDLLCYMSRPDAFIFMGLYFTKLIVILSLGVIILYHGLQEWRRKDSTSSAAAGHINTFTYHLVLMELFSLLGSVLFCCGIFMDDFNLVFYGLVLLQTSWYGEMFFHTLTCMEQYLAIVHPFIYLSLKNERGIRVRNISTACVWLLCLAEIGVMSTVRDDIQNILDFCLLLLSLSVVFFCSFSVLCVLIRPVPGEKKETRERMDESKKRAFCIILIILALLLLRFVWDLVWIVLYVIGKNGDCVLMICNYFIYLPNSLVLPLLFLQRTKMIPCFKFSKC